MKAHLLILSTLTGWRRNALAYLLGISATLAMPPVFLFPLLVPGFAGLILLLAAAPSRKRAFWDGWWWGLGHYMTGLYWICIALLTDPWKFGWLIPFDLIGLNGIIALYPAFAALLWYMLKPRTRGAWPFLFAAVWTLTEYARGHILFGFPWNLAGYSWAFSDNMAQSASVLGIYGLTFITVYIATTPIAGKKQMLAGIVMLALMASGGAWRLYLVDRVPEIDRFVPGVHMRLVQANIQDHSAWTPERQQRIFARYIQLSRREGIEDITHLIWPETAAPFALHEGDTRLVNVFASLAPPGGALITGILRSEGDGNNYRVWNSLAVFNQQGLTASYDKHHLVPFGEFIPLRHWLPPLVTPAGTMDFSRGPGPTTLSVPSAPPTSPLICYEALFPSETIAPAGPRPGWLLNITNDSWFGASSGPYQHFHMARFRAIEQGLPLVRAANTGISAVTDAYGRIITQSSFNIGGILDSGLPVAANTTIYGSYGFIYFPLLILTLAIFSVYYKIRRIF